MLAEVALTKTLVPIAVVALSFVSAMIDAQISIEKKAGSAASTLKRGLFLKSDGSARSRLTVEKENTARLSKYRRRILQNTVEYIISATFEFSGDKTLVSRCFDFRQELMKNFGKHLYFEVKSILVLVRYVHCT